MGDREDLASIRAIREVLKNRFTDAEVATLYNLNDRDKRKTLTYILGAEPHEIRDTLEQQDGWNIVSSKRPIPQDVVDRVRHGFITTTTRQYACQRCDVFWWRCVPERKQVSKCNRCKTKYDPVPRDREWGWAEFHCTFCNNDFSGYCQMNQASPCYRCRNNVFPTRIKPSQQRGRLQAQRSSYKGHSCDACRIGGGRNTTCVHPQTRQRNRLPKVVTPSNPHDSTGSTVDTFLPQNDLSRERFNVCDEIATLPSIDEGNESSDD